MTWSASKVLLLIAVICAAAAFIAVAFNIDNPDVYPAGVALALAFGFAAAVVP